MHCLFLPQNTEVNWLKLGAMGFHKLQGFSYCMQAVRVCMCVPHGGLQCVSDLLGGQALMS